MDSIGGLLDPHRRQVMGKGQQKIHGKMLIKIYKICIAWIFGDNIRSNIQYARLQCHLFMIRRAHLYGRFHRSITSCLLPWQHCHVRYANMASTSKVMSSPGNRHVLYQMQTNPTTLYSSHLDDLTVQHTKIKWHHQTQFCPPSTLNNTETKTRILRSFEPLSQHIPSVPMGQRLESSVEAPRAVGPLCRRPLSLMETWLHQKAKTTKGLKNDTKTNMNIINIHKLSIFKRLFKKKTSFSTSIYVGLQGNARKVWCDTEEM